MTWSATDPSNNVNAEVRFSGRLHNRPPERHPQPRLLAVSAAPRIIGLPSARPHNGGGDYSAVSLDPTDPTGATAWIVNERILSRTSWGSRIGRIRLPIDTSLPAVDLLLLGD